MNSDKNTPATIVGIGEILWDMLPDGKKAGGAPLNFSYHVNQFGLHGCAVSAIGKDELGKELLDSVTKLGMETQIAITDHPTGTVDVTLDADGVPAYEITRDVAWDNIPWTPELEALAKRTHAAAFGSLAQRSKTSRETIRRFLCSMPKEDDTLKIFDINLRQDFYDPETLTESLGLCNILKINDEELEIIKPILNLPSGSIKESCQAIINRYNLRILILTCGTKGSYIFSGQEESFIATPIVEVADTVGAGDSFTAAFTSSLIKGSSIADAHRKAVETSAYVCTCHGATPRLPAHITNC